MECCFVLGMDVDITPVLEEGKMDILECRLELRAKKCQILATNDKHMILGAPTCISMAVVKRKFMLALKEITMRIMKDTTGRYNKNKYKNAKELILELNINYTTGLPCHKYKEGEERPNNGRRAF